MQQLIVEHKNEMKKDRRSGKGRCIALSRRIYRLLQTDVFYVESDSTNKYTTLSNLSLTYWNGVPAATIL